MERALLTACLSTVVAIVVGGEWLWTQGLGRDGGRQIEGHARRESKGDIVVRTGSEATAGQQDR